ncbi:hypothetical protein JO972_05445 [Verrucomicrobiaceae bacterium 5K15]|uniref:Tetratricopeptide repeat protein n=1 Tax=Oceaniferula flava TaxID=2800421 RepID=A0AAE2SAB0_9BACT|nr:hypothetical protein [Oceaniferula flavus]MBK1854390.1 hypothetical protein [Oceaniferula flavus]MBM1135696.1 hypothetical protein [Oceaniferula flavus]
MIRRVSRSSTVALLASLSLSFTPYLCAEEVEVTPGKEQPAEVEKAPFKIEMVIAPRVSKMPEPKLLPGSVGIQMDVSSPSEAARAHVKQGFALVHAQWDFEAYRHFAAAIKADKDCLLAYCGVTLALARPYNEDVDYRRAAVDRMLDLMESDVAAMKKGHPERFPKIEKQFCAATATMVSDSPVDAGAMFMALGEKFPNLLQARLLGVFLTRGSYDVSGSASPAQLRAIEQTRTLLKENPENPLVLSFWLSLCAEAPTTAVNLKQDLLPEARRLVTKSAEVPSWWHTLGHLEWRAGNYLLAERAFTKAADLYAAWMSDHQVSLHDCPGFIKARCYLANTHYQRGNFTGAMKVAKELRAITPDISRPQSQGNHILLWRAYSLPARLYIAHGADGDMNRALKDLPSAEMLKPFASHPNYPSLVGTYINALRVYLGCRKAIDDKALTAAKSLHQRTFRNHIVNLVKVFEGAKRSSDASHYFHAGRCLAIYDKELAGLIRMNDLVATRVAAAGSFYSARDLQYVPTLMLPPMVLTPMENRLGEYYLHMGKNTEAYEAFTSGHLHYPNNMGSLLGMKRSLELLGKKEDAAMIQRHIDLVKPKA